MVHVGNAFYHLAFLVALVLTHRYASGGSSTVVTLTSRATPRRDALSAGAASTG